MTADEVRCRDYMAALRMPMVVVLLLLLLGQSCGMMMQKINPWILADMNLVPGTQNPRLTVPSAQARQETGEKEGEITSGLG